MRRILEELSDPAEHLSLDEAMLLAADAGELPIESIRLWEFKNPVVVLGRSSKVDHEVDRTHCEDNGIPIMRRCSGGASIVGGPGCLMYSVVLSQQERSGLFKIDAAHEYVMSRIASAILRQRPEVQRQGICDVTFEDRKCSGNSLRMAREYLLYHGTILYNADLNLISRCLREAPRQPEYRRRRNHDDFVTNVPIDVQQLRGDILHAFETDDDGITDIPIDRMAELKRLRYSNPSWHLRH